MHRIQHYRFVSAIARVQRNIGDVNQPFLPDLQVNTALQDIAPPASPSPRQFPPLGMKSPTYSHLPPGATLRTTTPGPAHDFSPNTPDTTDPYAQQPPTPKPQINAFQARPQGGDAFLQQPQIRQQFVLPQRVVQQVRFYF